MTPHVRVLKINHKLIIPLIPISQILTQTYKFIPSDIANLIINKDFYLLNIPNIRYILS